MRFKTVFSIFTLLFFLNSPSHVLAQETDIFIVQDIKVDLIDTNAVTAKNKAITQAQVDAFNVLLSRLLSAAEMDFFAETDPVTISTMVQDFEIVSEQLASNQYVGSFTVRFNEKAVRRYLKGTGASFSDITRDPILLLPYFQQGSRYIMFAETNPWLTAWQRQDTFKGLVPILVPLGDIQDMSDIGQSHPLQYDESALTRLAQRYSVKDILITIGAIEPETQEVRVYVYRTDGIGVQYAGTIRAGSALSEGFDEAVKQIQRFLAEDWKAKTALAADSDVQEIEVLTRFNSLREWAMLRKSLDKVSSLEEVEILSITGGQADLRLKFQGAYDRLELALRQAGMSIQYPATGGFGQKPILTFRMTRY